MVYWGAMLGKIGEAIQADTSEKRKARREDERYERERTDLIMDKALDLGTQEYYKRKEAAEAKRKNIEELMSRLETTGLTVDERFKIAQGGETSVNDIMQRFNTWTSTFKDADTEGLATLNFSNFYDIQKTANENSPTDYSSMSDDEFLKLFMPNTVKYDSSVATEYLAQYGISTDKLPDYFQFADQEADEKIIPELGGLQVNIAEMQKALKSPKEAKAYATIEAGLIDTQDKINDKIKEIKAETDPLKLKQLNKEKSELELDLRNFQSLKPGTKQSISDLLGDTIKQLAEEKNKGENADTNVIAKLTKTRDFYLDQKTLIESAGKTQQLNDIVANTTVEIDKLSKKEQTPNTIAKIKELEETQKAALDSIRAIQDQKEEAKQAAKPIEGTKSPFANINAAENFVAKSLTRLLGNEYAELTDTDQLKIDFTRGVGEAGNYSDYFDQMENTILPHLKSLVNDKKDRFDNTNVYYQDVHLSSQVYVTEQDYLNKMKNYYFKYHNNVDFKDLEGHLKLQTKKVYSNNADILKDYQNGKIKSGDFIKIGDSEKAVAVAVWTGKEVYYYDPDKKKMVKPAASKLKGQITFDDFTVDEDGIKTYKLDL